LTVAVEMQIANLASISRGERNMQAGEAQSGID
jgi:hypothetical protein